MLIIFLIYDFLAILITLLVQMVVAFLGLFIVPVALLWVSPYTPVSDSAVQENHKLLGIFHWWDNDMDGIDGSRNWFNQCGDSRTFWWRYKWLALRNACANFSRMIGVNNVWIIDFISYGDDHVSNRKGQEGVQYCIAVGLNGRRYPQFNWVFAWNETHCFRFTVGWSNNNVIPENLPKKYYYDFALSFQPYREYQP
jgi:hypothetical protein